MYRPHMLLTASLAAVFIIQHSHLYSAEEKKGVDLWYHYERILQSGKTDHVPKILPLMGTENTHPPYRHDDACVELPVADCSGLAIIMQSALPDHTKKKLIDTIVSFYQPKTLNCKIGCCFPCTSFCNQRRTAFIIYGLAKAGERCLELEASDDMRNYIYETYGAFVTQDALALLKKQGKTILKEEFATRRNEQNRQKQLLLSFNCFKQNPGSSYYCASEYYHQIACPVIHNKKPGSSAWNVWVQLCPKE